MVTLSSNDALCSHLCKMVKNSPRVESSALSVSDKSIFGLKTKCHVTGLGQNNVIVLDQMDHGPAALEILKKYENHPLANSKDRLLPIRSNQKMNSYLKELADICGIQKNLTMHIARHTFATSITLS